MKILDSIGNTSMVQLRHVVPADCADIYVKLEWENPTGSMKDRMALGAIRRAEDDGRLAPGDTVVEYSGGSTGASLALVCAARGYRLKLVSSDAFSQEKRDHMAALGAEMTIVPSEGGLATRQLFLDMIEVTRGWAEAPRTFWLDQLSNPDIIAGGHRIEGIGVGRTPPLWKPSVADEILAVSSADAEAMARRIAREEGLLAGTSSGANVVAALRVAKALGPEAKVATLMVDSGLKYLSTGVYRRQGS